MQVHRAPIRPGLRHGRPGRQAGLSLWCWGLLLAVGALLVGTGSRCVPIFIEYQAVSKAVRRAALLETPAQVRAEFDRIAQIEGFYALKGTDLDIDGQGSGQLRVRFAYRREVPLAGPAALAFNFAGSAP